MLNKTLKGMKPLKNYFAAVVVFELQGKKEGVSFLDPNNCPRVGILRVIGTCSKHLVRRGSSPFIKFIY
jgi:hypothetical protein